MNKLFEIAIVVIVVLVAVFVVFFFWVGRHPDPPSIIFVGMTNNPTRQMSPTRVEVSGDATGPCALFLVTNAVGNQYVWFKTTAVEQKTKTGWQPYVPGGGPWTGIGGMLWQPGYGCLIAVSWPPGLPTNATWRLELSYGADPSSYGILINQRLGRNIFGGGKPAGIIPSPEVSQ